MLRLSYDAPLPLTLLNKTFRFILLGQFTRFAGFAPSRPGRLCSGESSPSFGIRFSPVKFSAQNHSTSELLRTL